RDHAATARAMIMLACAAAILFPAISITDDLHQQAAAAEDSTVYVRKLKSSVQRLPTHTCPFSTIGFLPPSSAALPVPDWTGRTESLSSTSVDSRSCSIQSGRAPPRIVIPAIA